MPRYFLELAYQGTAYHGFQVQDNALTIQGEVEKALKILFKESIALTGSSRTDAGVHALQNYFQFDTELVVEQKHLYNLNAILPADIVAKSVREVSPTAHCRFDAVAREYQYHIYGTKDPFMRDRGWYYPYALNIDLLQAAADCLLNYTDFTSFAKRNTQVFTHNCELSVSLWQELEKGRYIYTVKGNRFLRGMVRGLVGTMVKVGRGQLSVAGFEEIIKAKDCRKADFSTPPQGLFLAEVIYL